MSNAWPEGVVASRTALFAALVGADVILLLSGTPDKVT